MPLSRSVLDNNVACLVDEEGAYLAATVLWARAVAADPNNHPARASLGSALYKAGRVDEAWEHAIHLSKLGEARAACEGHRLLGMVYAARADLESALKHFQRALQLGFPGDPERLADVGWTHMKMEDYTTGWPLYQAACSALCYYDKPNFPRWDGTAGKDVVVVTDQGFGDQVMCSRFMPWVIERSKRVVLLAKPAECSLFAKIDVPVVLDLGAQKFDYQINMTGLPELYGCTPANVPPVISYIDDSTRVPEVLVDGIKVGICWAGSHNHHVDHFRSTTLETLLPLAEDPLVHLYSFQCGKRSGDISVARAQRLVRDLSGQIEGDWSQTVAALRRMDVVVCPDTALAHVAATVGVPTCVMVSAWSCWRWGTGATTHWYPNVRIFRQGQLLRWGPVVDEIKSYLRELRQVRKAA